jgi:hypothetical protein
MFGSLENPENPLRRNVVDGFRLSVGDPHAHPALKPFAGSNDDALEELAVDIDVTDQWFHQESSVASDWCHRRGAESPKARLPSMLRCSMRIRCSRPRSLEQASEPHRRRGFQFAAATVG